jgi:hypothetical protein
VRRCIELYIDVVFSLSIIGKKVATTIMRRKDRKDMHSIKV